MYCDFVNSCLQRFLLVFVENVKRKNITLVLSRDTKDGVGKWLVL